VKRKYNENPKIIKVRTQTSPTILPREKIKKIFEVDVYRGVTINGTGNQRRRTEATN